MKYFAFAFAALLTSAPLAAQARQSTQPRSDSTVLHGVVTDARKHAVRGARIVVREISGSFADSTVTDSAGRYSIPLPPTQSGSFAVIAGAIGFAPSRDVVSAASLTAAPHNFILATPAAALAAVHVTAKRNRPSIPGDLTPYIGGLGSAASGLASNLAPGSYAGDVLGFAALSPSLTLQKSASGQITGISAMGLGPDQTSISFDGADVRGIHIPRDAQVAARVATSVYDPSEGGFSGAKVEISTQPGANIGGRHVSASGSANLASGSPSATTTVDGDASGYLVLDRLLYNSSVELSRMSTPFATFDPRVGARLPGQLSLSSADAEALQSGLGNFNVSGLRASQQTIANSLSTLNRIDFVPDSDHSIALIASASASTSSPFGSSTAAIGNLFGDEQSTDIGLTLERKAISDILAQETSLAVSFSTGQISPAAGLPLLRVRVPGTLNGAASTEDLLAGSFQGSASATREASFNAKHTIRWLSSDNRHHSDAGLSLRVIHDSDDPTGNQFGSVSFDSLGALATGIASAYTRDVNPARSYANVGTLSGFIGDLWTPHPHLSVEGGVRLDLNQFSIPGARANTSATDAALGLSSAVSGRSFDASPRLGFTWDIPAANARVAQYTLRGGVGRFVNDARPGAFLPASLPFIGAGSLRRLDCSGGNVPNVDWSSLNEASLPTSCSDGALPIAQNVTGSVIASDWKPAATWRGNFGGTARLQTWWNLSADYTHSVTTRISSLYAANLSSTPVFTLDAEGGRPVFADAAQLANSSVFAQVIPARANSGLGSVNYLLSDMRSVEDQIELGASYSPPGASFFEVHYVYASARALTRGLDGYTGGDPRALSWSPSSTPSHRFTFQAYHRFGTRASLNVTGHVQSGLRYTPWVAGDVNGDGLLDDRAYVAEPSSADAALADGIGRLIASAPAGARDCLRSALGKVAGQNSCVGPWTESLDGTLIMPIGPSTMVHRPVLRVELLNVISGLDAAIHGVNGMHGWGGEGTPDNVLLTETAFEPASSQSGPRYSYAVNPAFGSVRAYSAFQNPFSVRVSLSIPLSRSRVAQQLAIDASRKQHPSVETLIDRYVAQYPNVGFAVLAVADSVDLNKVQRDSLAHLGQSLNATLRTIWRPVAERIHGGLPNDASTHLIKAARTPASISYKAYAAMVGALLDDGERARLPEKAKWVITPGSLKSMGLEP